MKGKRPSREPGINKNPRAAEEKRRSRPHAGLWVVCVYLLFLQPLFYFVIPVVRYDEFRLPAREPMLMLSHSIDAWWRVLVVFFGIICGVRLWRQRSDALASMKLYLMAYLASACLLIAVPYFLPFQSFLRTHILSVQSRVFLEAMIVFVLGYGYFARSRRYREYFAMAGPALAKGLSGSQRQVRAIVGVSAVVGLTCSLAAFRVQPRDIFEAAWEGRADAVRRFIDAGVDVNSSGFDGATPLHLASTREVAELFTETPSEIEDSYLLKPDDLKDAPSLIRKLRLRADPVSALLWTRFSASGRDALTNGAFPERELPDIVLGELNSILRQGLRHDAGAFAGVPLSPSTLALKTAELTGMKSLNLSRHLLEDAFPQEIAKYQIDARNLLKETPLHIAAFNGRMDVTSFLVQRGAYLNAGNVYQWTPLDYAVFARGKGRKGDFDRVISLLREHGGHAAVLQHRMQLETLAGGPGARF